MKIPNILTIRQALTLAIAAIAIAAFLKLFGSLAVALLAAIAALAAAYAAIMKWAPEYIAEKKA